MDDKIREMIIDIAVVSKVNNDFVAQLRQLGYTVTEVSANIIEVNG